MYYRLYNLHCKFYRYIIYRICITSIPKTEHFSLRVDRFKQNSCSMSHAQPGKSIIRVKNNDIPVSFGTDNR